MKQFELIGHENLFNRDVFMMVLDQLNVEVQEPPTMGQFACLCVLHGRSNASVSFSSAQGRLRYVTSPVDLGRQCSSRKAKLQTSSDSAGMFRRLKRAQQHIPDEPGNKEEVPIMSSVVDEMQALEMSQDSAE